MAPAVTYARRRLVRRSTRVKREATLTEPLPWTVGDDEELDRELLVKEKRRRSERRQELIPVVPGVPSEPAGVVPEPGRLQPLPAPVAGIALDEGAADSTSSESTENDPFSSESSDSSGDEFEDPNVETDGNGRRPIEGSPARSDSASPTADVPYEEIPGTSTSSGSSSSATEAPSSSTSTSSIIFSTVPRSSEVAKDWDSVTSSATATATSSNAENTSSSVSDYQEAIPQISTTTSIPSTDAVKEAYSTTAVAEADTSAPPQVIRIHEHPHGLSKDAIHGLIAFGALGGLMGVLAIAWFFWRRMKKRNRPLSTTEKSRTFDTPKPPPYVQLLAKVPFLKNRFGNRSWFNLDDPYYNNNNNSAENVYQEKSWTQTSTSASRLDSQFFSPDQVMGIAVRVQGGDHAPNGNVSGHAPSNSMSSSMQQQRSESQRSKVHPFPVNPTYRLSEMSSLSSGFGDDIAPPNGESTMERNMPQPPPSAYGGSRRDTVYTEASEDLPPRHRNVNSWVKQQTSRVKRSQARAEDDDAPPVPQMPVEQDFRLMLPDGEVPRKVEGSDSGVPGVAR